MNAIANGALYNTTPLDDDGFLSRFVARGDIAAFLLGQLKATGPTAVAEHHLIVGMRGMGKTSLLRRVAIGVLRDPDLAERFAPLTFREEQYNVLTLDGLWRNCGEALAEWCERTGLTAEAERLDKRVESPEWCEAEVAQREFLSACRSLGRRPVLLIDNIDLVLEALSPIENWTLRRVLQANDGPILFGAATQFLTQSGDRTAPFYEFFRPHHLEPLSSAEVMACLRVLADSRGAAGDPVRATLAREPERLEALHALTGGNPRILVILYSLLEAAGDRTAFQDLEALLDQVTPLYKARVEEYQTKLQRAVIDAIALNWHPITAHDLSGATGTQVTTISSQLVRLERDGLIESVQTSGARAGFQLVERFFNIWYLMRHGSRRTRNRVRWLTEFLLGFYTPDELKVMSMTIGKKSFRSRWHELYNEALLGALEKDTNKSAIPSYGSKSGRSDPGQGSSRTPHNPWEFEVTVWRYIDEGDFSAALNAAENEFRRLSDTSEPAARESLARTMFYRGLALHMSGRIEETVSAYNDLILNFGGDPEPTLREEVAAAMFIKGLALGQLGHDQDAVVAYEELILSFGEAKELILHNHIANASYQMGNILIDHLNRPGAAEEAYRRAIAIAAKDASPFAEVNLAWLLVGAGRLDEALEIIGRLNGIPDIGMALLKSAIEFVLDNFGNGCRHFHDALNGDQSDLATTFFDDQLRLLRIVHSKGYGEQLIGWFEESGQADRQAPLFAAFVAYVRGAKRLLDFNPEVRGPADRIFAWLTNRRRTQAEGDVPAAKSRTHRRK